MTRYLILLAATAAAAGSLVSVNARTAEPSPTVVSKTADGKPIMLGRMVVTATALPDEE